MSYRDLQDVRHRRLSGENRGERYVHLPAYSLTHPYLATSWSPELRSYLFNPFKPPKSIPLAHVDLYPNARTPLRQRALQAAFHAVLEASSQVCNAINSMKDTLKAGWDMPS